MPNLPAENRLLAIQQRIRNSAEQAKRSPDEIQLLGASKAQSAATIAPYLQQGLKALGENYLQEALQKQSQLSNYDVQWHYIGAIQSRKCKAIAQHFDWVHSVDNLKVAQNLNRHRADAPLQILIQVNIDQEQSKSGVAPDEAEALIESINELEQLNVRGLMVLPKSRKTLDEQRQPFAKTRQLLDSLNQRLEMKMDTLSMGMSSDLEAAILEGSTIVRVGTALFGSRD